MRRIAVACICSVAVACAPEKPELLRTGRWIDLTHDFSAKTIYWPTAKPFALEVVILEVVLIEVLLVIQVLVLLVIIVEGKPVVLELVLVVIEFPTQFQGFHRRLPGQHDVLRHQM
jgi:hypothetical protein